MVRRFLVLSLIALSAIAAFARGPLTFEERAKAQQAIERVYYAHRIWPKENPQPKPPFEQMVPRSVIEAKVTDYLKKCAALDKYWQRPIQPNQLQAEMDRMAKGSKDVATLRQLCAALNDDPWLIAECLARPILADRLVQHLFAADSGIFSQAREQAERALTEASPEALDSWPGGAIRRVTYRLKFGEGAQEGRPPAPGTLVVEKAVLDRIRAQLPPEVRLAMRETEQAFLVERVISESSETIATESLIFEKTPLGRWWEKTAATLPLREPSSAADAFHLPAFAAPTAPALTADSWTESSLSPQDCPEPRFWHTSVWTGTEMIVWGGFDGFTYFFAGGRYNPATDTWASTSVGANCPAGRWFHKTVWTGTEMIVWGGGYGVTFLNTGGRYNPSTDAWVPTSTEGLCPSGRSSHTAVWTGKAMIVWGGESISPSGDYSDLNSGGIYDPGTDTWAPTSTAGACPSPRDTHTAVWTGSAMIVWGGYWCDDFPNCTPPSGSLNSGGLYDPSSDKWTATPESAKCPSPRYSHSAVWTGSEMIVWGGISDAVWFNTGGRYNPSTGKWKPTSTAGNCPSARFIHSAVWTGKRMIIWGGGMPMVSTGGLYDPKKNKWTATSTGAGCPTPRYAQTAVWTGNEMIVWGGSANGFSVVGTGGRYAPSTDTWVPTYAPVTPTPVARYSHSAVWTGAEMIVWGGIGGGSLFLNTGGRYDPATDAWTATSTGIDCPDARLAHSAIWTGQKMIVWGGGLPDFNTGGIYNPVTDSWQPTSTGEGCPEPRDSHTAVWTGSAMIVWGGSQSPLLYNTGGRYDPSANSWAATSTGTGCPSARAGHTAVWTGAEMLIWGGSGDQILNTGGRYNPLADAWSPISKDAGCPSPRWSHTAVWTGSEMIIWGGDDFGYLNTGGRYDPAADTWTTTSMGASCPSPRGSHSAIWTGQEMVAWGGEGDSPSFLNTGGRYDPSADTWTPTSVGANCPVARCCHTAIWTGTQMIIWGGYNGDTDFNTGGIYIP